MVDSRRYKTLLMRAVDTIISPIELHFGIMPHHSNYVLFPNKKPELMKGMGGNVPLAPFFDLRNKHLEVHWCRTLENPAPDKSVAYVLYDFYAIQGA